MKARDYLSDDQKPRNISGATVRKGTVGSLLVNARVWLDRGTADENRATAEADIIEALPGVKVFRLFDILAIRDERPRKFVAERL